MSGNGIRALAWAAVRDGYGRDGRLVVDTGGGRRELDLDARPATGELTYATVDMGPVTFDPAQIPVALESSSNHCRVRRRGVRGAVGRHGQPASRAVRRRSAPASASPQHGPPLELDERFPAAPTWSSSPTSGAADELDMRVVERGVGETLGVRHRRVPPPRPSHTAGVVRRQSPCTVPGGELDGGALGDGTIRLGGPVSSTCSTSHRRRLMSSAAHESKAAHRDRGRPRRRAATCTARRHRLRH